MLLSQKLYPCSLAFQWHLNYLNQRLYGEVIITIRNTTTNYSWIYPCGPLLFNFLLPTLYSSSWTQTHQYSQYGYSKKCWVSAQWKSMFSYSYSKMKRLLPKVRIIWMYYGNWEGDYYFSNNKVKRRLKDNRKSVNLNWER